MEENKTKRKVKRILKDISFENDAAHLALVHREQGGPANLADYRLVVKSTEQYSDEFLEKASQISVTLPIEEYLQRFFFLAEQDAEVLARTLGFTTEMQDEVAAGEEKDEYNYNDYINQKVASIQVMKSLHEAEDIATALMQVQEADYIQFLKDQQYFEKALQDSNSTAIDSAKAAEVNTSLSGEVNKEVTTSVVKQAENKEVIMQANKICDKQVEQVEKAQFDALLKANEDQKVMLEKALAELEVFKAEKQELINKARVAALEEVLGDKAEGVFKAIQSLDDAAFGVIVKSFKEMQDKIEKSALFQEQSAQVEGDTEIESAVAKLLKSKYSK